MNGTLHTLATWSIHTNADVLSWCHSKGGGVGQDRFFGGACLPLQLCPRCLQSFLSPCNILLYILCGDDLMHPKIVVHSQIICTYSVTFVPVITLDIQCGTLRCAHCTGIPLTGRYIGYLPSWVDVHQTWGWLYSNHNLWRWLCNYNKIIIFLKIPVYIIIMKIKNNIQ